MRRIGLLLLFLAFSAPLWAEQRFPPPDFESGYTQPPLTFQEERPGPKPYLDAVFLLGALGITAWLLHARRSRAGLFVIGVVSLMYLGFYKEGCVCPIGAIQNISLGLADPNYLVSIPIIVFFVLPLLFALFWGRVFCGGVCPLGAIQDLFLFRPVQVPKWLDSSLSLLRYFYLGLAVFFAVMYSRFVICEYDPFVSLFRFNGPDWRLLLGAVFLGIGLFVARPYCRYLCPYGVLLSWFSRWSSVKVRITPKECINCTLCDAACPFGAIHRPSNEPRPTNRLRGWGGLAAVGCLTGLTAGGYFAIGQTLAGGLLGFWMGAVVGGKMLVALGRTRHTLYEPDQGACLSCGRCYESCPHQRARWEEQGYVPLP
jgi:ferredoxin